MAIVGYVEPTFNATLDVTSFTCPHCNCFSQHQWRYISVRTSIENRYSWITSWCLRCNEYCLWREKELVWPIESGLPDLIDGAPEKVRAVYDEARAVFPNSPRASAALLRLAIQLVCKEKGLPGKDLNVDIGELVKQGLSREIQQSLDLLRVIGNHAVHPGQIVIEDNRDQIERFFGLLNLIVDALIVQPAKINAMFSTLVPAGQQQQIADRDGKP